MTKGRKLTEADGRQALRGHVADRALLARERYGDPGDPETFRAILEDRDVVRFPVSVVYDAAPLEPGEFAFAAPLGEHPSAGFRLCVHPRYAGRPEVLPILGAYHIVSVNYGDIATHEEAELFGATLLGMDVDDYYRRVCELADELLPGAEGSAPYGCGPAWEV